MRRLVSLAVRKCASVTAASPPATALNLASEPAVDTEAAKVGEGGGIDVVEAAVAVRVRTIRGAGWEAVALLGR